MWEFFQGRKKETLVTVVDMLSYNNFYSTSRNNSYDNDNDNDNDDVDGFFNVLACFLLSASKKKMLFTREQWWVSCVQDNREMMYFVMKFLLLYKCPIDVSLNQLYIIYLHGLGIWGLFEDTERVSNRAL